ncbi:MAG: DUF885 domain-containing protein [Acidobacteriaceae bacterium]|nr:DUF885 domain-containing protein [Acidobacteriaceae bacterium]
MNYLRNTTLFYFLLLGVMLGYQQPSNKLSALFTEEWDYELKTNPEMATAIGDSRFNAELSDYSPAFHARDLSRKRAFLQRFEAIRSEDMTPAESLNLQLMIRRLRTQIDEVQFKRWEMPVDQFNGIHLELAQLPHNTRFNTVKDYEDYVSRLRQFPRAFRQIEETLQLGIKDRLMPPRYLLEKTVTQAQGIAQAQGDTSSFAAPVREFPSNVSPAEVKRLRAEVLQAIEQDVRPAYRELAQFLQNTYAPHGRSEPGVWSIPQGDAYYRQQIRVMTTTDWTPEQFHQIGLGQVGEIEREMLTLAQKLGFQNLRSFHASIQANKKLYAQSGEQVLQIYANHIKDMRTKMPELFGRQPKTPLEIVPMESFRAKESVPADYSPGSPTSGRPGRINVNEYDPTHRLTLNMEAIAYHEGIPGHHQQFALAQEMTGLPEFRKFAEYNAFSEGWALYSERLGKEVGFYRDPYSEYGRLENEMWRAVRLVVDTGMHSEHWTRQQMVDFFHAHTAMDEPNVQTEVDRYIAWPAQALAYKAGQIKILELRERARRQLGGRFDLRAFHDAVLANGAVPLDVLDGQITAWIRNRKKAEREND